MAEKLLQVREPEGMQGKVIIRSHPAGAIEKFMISLLTQNEIESMGIARAELGEEFSEWCWATENVRDEKRRKLINDFIDGGKLEVEQKNMIVWALNYGFDVFVQFLISQYTGLFSINSAATLTGTTDGTTAAITGLSSTAGLAPGMNISGAGILPYSTVISIDSGTQITISQNTNASGTVPLYFVQKNQLGIGWGELGTGNTVPTNMDVALTTPTNRSPVSYAADLGFNEAQLQFFFPDAVLANQTYYECGSFIGGSSTIGSGNLFNHALFATPYSKSGGTDTTLQITFSFANS